MSQSLARRFFLSAVICTLGTTLSRAQSTNPTPTPVPIVITPGSVTGGDPVPTKPQAVPSMLYLLWLLL